MRKSFDGLRGIIRSAMHLDPLSGGLFLFKNRRGDRIKAVYFDSDGFAMWYKVLQRGTFQFPDLQNFSSAGLEIDAATLRMILDAPDQQIDRGQTIERIATVYALFIFTGFVLARIMLCQWRLLRDSLELEKST